MSIETNNDCNNVINQTQEAGDELVESTQENIATVLNSESKESIRGRYRELWKNKLMNVIGEPEIFEGCSVWLKEGENTYSIEKFNAGYRGIKEFDSLEDAVEFMLEHEDCLELRCNRGYYKTKKPYTGEITLSNGFNRGIHVEGKNSGKHVFYGSCAWESSYKFRIIFNSGLWYTGRNENGIIEYIGRGRDGSSLKKELGDEEFIITFETSNPQSQY